MNRLFDPDMFDFMMESVNHDRYVIATYYIEDTLPDQDWVEHLQQVQRMALEGSTSSWQRVKEDTGEVREKLTSKVLGYYEIPNKNIHKKSAVIQLGFPIDAWDTNLSIPMMLLTVAGNAFVFGDQVKLLDVYFPKEVADRFKGPKFGISGLRKKKGIPERPMSLHIIKPKMGMTPEQTANQVFQTALGGADFAKDDEMLSELGNSSWEKRLEAVLKSVDKAEKETGKRLTYMLSITDSYNNLIPKAKRAVKLGAEGILVAYSAGPAALRALAEDPEIDVPILLHISHMLAGLHHINFPTYSKICRLCGADMILSPCIWTTIPASSPEECARNYQELVSPFYNIKRTFPMPAAGMYPGLMPVLMEEFGNDMIIPAGGGMLGHPTGYKEGAMAWQQAIEATMKGIKLSEFAKDHKELKAAIDKWGVRERPKTYWGYVSKEFNPDYADKNLDL